MRGGPPPGSARADLWVIERPGEDLIGKCRVGDEIRLRLVENRSTGYVWRIEEAAGPTPHGATESLVWDGGQGLNAQGMRTGQLAMPTAQDVIRVAADRHLGGATSRAPELATSADPLVVSDDGEQSWLREVLGSGGVREIVVIAENRGDGLLRVDLRPPWDAQAPALATVSLTIRVVPPHELDGFAPLQPAAHVARLAAPA